MDAFVGTKRLVQLALRRDRVKLPLWIAIIVTMVAASAPALETAYPTLADKIVYASTSAPSVIAKFMGGVIDGPNLGAILMVETFLFTAMLMAFMSVFAVTRHTRANEEDGSAELIGSGVVGRYAPLSAALIVASLANIVIGLLIFVFVAQTEGLSTLGSFYFASALTITGIVFSAIAGVCVQLTDYAKGANALGSTIIGVSFVIRGIGDGLGSVGADGLSASTSWFSWLSPLTWGFQVNPFTDKSLWLLGLSGILIVLLVTVSFVLLRHRDIGSGIYPSRAGRAFAKPQLLSVNGLAWRLQKNALFGWAIAFTSLGIMYAFMAKEFVKLIEQNEFAQEFFSKNSDGNVPNIFFSTLLSLSAVFAVGFAVQAMTKMRSEESSGRLENLAGASISRRKWLASHVSIAIVGTITIVILTGLAAAFSNVLISNVAFTDSIRLVQASLVQLPAILLFCAVVVLSFSRLPSYMIGIGWGFYTFCLLIGQFALLLKLPEWTVNLSPFSHTPIAPAPSINIAPLVIMGASSIVVFALSFIIFRRRDLTIS